MTRIRDRARVIRSLFVARYFAMRAGAMARAVIRGGTPSGLPRVAVVYVYPTVGDPSHDEQARRFVETYRSFPALWDHTLHVVFNGRLPCPENLDVLEGIPFVGHQHDDSGWDIGAFQAAAHEVDSDLMVFFGGSTYFNRAGWLNRMIRAYQDHGTGLYGASASYEISPHIRTTGFWCDPSIVRAYPKQVVSYDDRYAFEHSRASLTSACHAARINTWLVTWSDVYDKSGWRTAENIFRRGDQSNAIVFDRQFDMYAEMSEEDQRRFADMADGRL